MSPAFYVGVCFGILAGALGALAAWWWAEHDR